MSFLREEECETAKTPEGNQGRVAQLKGTSKEISRAFEMLINYILKYENHPPKPIY